MSLNDLHYTSIFLMLIFMIVFFAFFVHFIYRELGGVGIGRDTFLFSILCFLVQVLNRIFPRWRWL